MSSPINKTLKKTALVLAISMLTAGSQADLIISEYIEGSSYNKAIELQNTGTEEINLSQYNLELYSNGKTSLTASVNLTGSLAAGGVYVLAHGSASNDILTVANQISSSVINFNGDDTLILKQGETVVDSFGQYGYDPGSQWSANGVSTANATLRRHADITSGDTNPDDEFDPSLQWDAYPQDTFDGLGDGSGNDGNGGTATEALISDIQGSGSSSPMIDEQVIVTAVVIAVYQDEHSFNGFFIQEEDADQDGDASTSEGIFVYSSQPVQVGDQVKVTAKVTEYFDLTELTDVSTVEVLANDQPLPATTIINLPLSSTDQLEAVEGMLVEFPQTLTVNEVYQLGRYGQMLLSQGRRYQGTEIALPGEDALAVIADNALNVIKLDDGFSNQNPVPVIYPVPGLSALNTVRIGDSVPGITGVIYYSFGEYLLEPVGEVTFDPTNQRTLAPQTDPMANLKVASFNVLNFFNGDGQGGGFPTSRGADNAEEFQRQLDKLVPALVALDSDIVGLMEIENDGYDEYSAIATLVDTLNAELPADKAYTYVDPGLSSLGSDEIAVGMIYRPASVQLLSSAKLDSSNSALDPDTGEPLFNDGKNRTALAVSFEHVATGQQLTVSVNHLKSKGSDCVDLGDPDLGDGQGNCNLTRTMAAEALAQWLQDTPTGIDTPITLIIGDLNSYAMEDPIRTLESAGFNNLKKAKGLPGDYSYVFDGQSGSLDHALGNQAALDATLLVTDWHINTDEPAVLDYNTEYKYDGQAETLYNADPYRSSDHDPVIISMSLTPANEPPIALISHFRIWNWHIFIADSFDPDGRVVKNHWNFVNWDEFDSWFAFVPESVLKRNRVGQIILTATDNDGASSEDVLTLSNAHLGHNKSNHSRR
ncbi:ExeM/NucH family extracellular endonuclease [Gynuella sunshinyii]|uniref:Putative extracellular nuclease n=1 Tax=Gynuella sunshinyii YC6258 TaxID=1445510 RepID=A0A0C5VP81_9GAMM|nr:ExeM/NucH family extracellular endonuclease [Gynuella sunshinyii]AJQ96081.1 putative extracellular nuclease [Gynuella sunshinyii YC6258]